MRDEVRRPPDSGVSGLTGPQVFSPGQLALLQGAGVPQTWRRGDTLLRQGETADRAILLTGGMVKIVSESVGGYTSLLAFRGPGELVGELACIDGGVRSASVVALQDGCGTAMAGGRFTALLRANGDLGLAVLRSISTRLRHADVQRKALGAEPAAVRVARLLVELADRYGTKTPNWAPSARSVRITQHELSGAVGTSRESVVRTLRKLQSEELVATRRGSIVVLDPAGLAAWEPDRP
ncbi:MULTISPECIES: Crp/Fnr family transcriptional regulator [Streptomyces]|uniref:Crp/Fnr family transcriptional regulator n=1 Tax=Streptomyces TaxID=1883 RepID=UPI002B208B1C|nr:MULTISPECIES: Crp/Fnr family transcriptional regulator [Streptomyces]